MEGNQNDNNISEMTEIVKTLDDIETIEQAEYAAGVLKMRGFKSVCGKIGLSMCVFYICRIICDVLQYVLFSFISDAGVTTRYFLATLMSVVFVYAVPLLFTIIVFDVRGVYKKKLRFLYKRPAKMAKVMGNFPAVYGLGQAVNILTLIAVYLLSYFKADRYDVIETYKGISTAVPPNFASACIFAFVAVIIAPVIEEFWVRGVMFDALKPYGNGFAIVITAVIFGAMHSNIHSLFFATALGLAFGYITYATGSIFTSTVMHAVINGISGILVMFMSAESIDASQIRPQNEFISVMFYIYVIIVYSAVFVGIISFIKKIKIIRHYKVEKKWAELGFMRRLMIFMTSFSTIVWILLSVNAHLGNPLTVELIRFLSGERAV